MLGSKTILIVDEGGYAALDLSQAIAESEGCVAGPVATFSDALSLLDSTEVSGAVVDCGLDEASALVMLLAERLVPMVVQVSSSFGSSLGDLDGRAGVVIRPVDPRTVLECLLVEIGKSEMRASNTLGAIPKKV